MEHREFAAAVAEHQRRVFSFACYHLGSRPDAEDATQEVFVRLWHHPQMLESDRVLAWLLRVTRNLCLDLLRKRSSSPTPVDLGAVEAAGAGHRPGPPDPETLAVSSQLGRSLCSALGRVPEPQRSIVILREVQGLSYRDISAALDLPLNTVRVYLHRGRRALRDHLREVYEHARTA
jgi:RNA polymerase sigma-70 factor (ECF subfamily)